LSIAAVILFQDPATACTNFLVTKGASTDGATMITYSADSHVLYGELYYTPARLHLPGAMLDIIEWDTGKFLGQIKQVPKTYAVVGNMNEHQLTIGETTFGGRPELTNPKGVVDYGSLMYIALQRAKTAREAIHVMTGLMAEYGYYSSGESFSIADPNEVWLFEFIGKGPGVKGALWVARKVPDGYITGHANGPRIRQFPLNDPDTLYAPDVITFAREKGWFTGNDADFSFADVYGALDFGASRFCDARVWCMYRRAAPSQNFPDDWVNGVPGAKPLPLFIKPDKKLSVHDLMELMRDHFEGTGLDMTKDIGAGPYALPYRWRPLTWKVESKDEQGEKIEKEYLNERATSTQQTGFSFVTQSRSWLPDPIGGVLWFGVDDTYSTVYVPMYCGITRAPHGFAVGTGSFHEVTWESAFWVFNYVANFAYLRYNDMIKDVQKAQRELEGEFLGEQAAIEAAALALHQQSPRSAVDYLTAHSARLADRTIQRWRKLGEFLLYKYMDGNVKDELGKVKHPGYPEAWYQQVALVAGDNLAMRKLEREKAEEAEKKIKDEAQRKDLVQAITTLMKSRGVQLNGDAHQKVEECKDLEKLKGMLVRAATAKSGEEVTAEPEVASTH
jgi:dipeptidase